MEIGNFALFDNPFFNGSDERLIRLAGRNLPPAGRVGGEGVGFVAPLVPSQRERDLRGAADLTCFNIRQDEG